MKELSERLGGLLEQSIEDYIKTAVPIASGTLAQKIQRARSPAGRSAEGTSPATLRNDLKTLEEMGYLKQVHTSGGRIPTTDGYRIYVNKVLGGLNIKPGELSFALEQISSRTAELPGLIDEICGKLEKSFNYPIIVRQQFDRLIVQDIKVVNLVEGSTMVLIKTNAGSLNQIIQTDTIMTDRQCDDAASAFNTRCIGLTLKNMIAALPEITKQLGNEIIFFEKLCRGLCEKLEQCIERNVSRRNLIKLLDVPPDVGSTLKNDDIIEQVLSAGDTVQIGDGTGVIKFAISTGGESIASVGILGPERMDYKALIGALYSLMSTTVQNRKLEVHAHISEANMSTTVENRKIDGGDTSGTRKKIT